MIDFLYIAAAFQALSENPAKSNSVLLKLEITAGDIFQIDLSMLQALCEKLRDGVGLTECGRTEDVLPYGRSQDAKIENGRLSTIIRILKSLKFGGQHSYASTDDFIMAFSDGMVRDFSIGLINVICQCNICKELLSSELGGHCGHLPGQEDENGDVATYTIKEGQPIFISAEPFQLTEHENIQLLREAWGLDRAALEKFLSQSGELDKNEVIDKLPGASLIVTSSHPSIHRRPRKSRSRYRSGS